MSTIHDQIQKYILGKLTEDEVDTLWMNYLHQPVWYDYFITELTAKRVISSRDSKQYSHVHVLWNEIQSKAQQHAAK